jgi:ABC-type phosphate transport system substrate-binding protein
MGVWIGPTGGQAATIAAIVNPGNATSGLSSIELCDILLGDRQRWSNGGRVQVLAPPVGSPEWAAVLKAVCGMSEAGFVRQLNSRRALGRASRPPQVVATPSDMRRLVAGSPNALGFLTASQLDGSVKALTVDGLSPTQPGYPIGPPGPARP